MNFDYLRNKTLGCGNSMEGQYCESFINYVDYSVSNKWLRFLEDYHIKLGKIYSNIHLDHDPSSKYTIQLYNKAKEKIRKCVGANENYYIIPAGTGAIQAIDKFTEIIGLYKRSDYFRGKIDSNDKKTNSTKSIVFVSSYEYHLMKIHKTEGEVEVVKIGLDHNGVFDLEELKKHVSNPKYKDFLKIGAFSPVSDITGLKIPVYEIAKLMHKYGGYIFYDYSISGPYTDINMTKDYEAYFDGIYLSMSEFIGGKGATGTLILNNAIYNVNNREKKLVDYENFHDVGTRDIMNVIRTSMILEIKEKIGVEIIERTEAEYIRRALYELMKVENVDIIGNLDPDKRIALVSFNIKYRQGYLHHGFVSDLLNDLFGIQSKVGWASDEPYSINYLNIENKKIQGFKGVIDGRIISMKQGWTQVNFHYTLDKSAFDYIISAIKFIANHGHEFLEEYKECSVRYSGEKQDMNFSKKDELSLLDAFLLKRKRPQNNSKDTNNKYPKHVFKQYYVNR